MSLTSTQLNALKTELNTDPKTLGIAAKLSVGDDQGIADLLNAIHASGGDFQVNREPVAPSVIVTKIAPEDFQAMTTSQQGQLALLFVISALNLSDTNTFTNLTGCFPNDGDTIRNLTLLQKRQGSRAEVLFGNGVVVTSSDVAHAKELP